MEQRLCWQRRWRISQFYLSSCSPILNFNRSAAYHSPTDNLMTPVTRKLSAAKKKHFTKCVFVLPTFMSFADSRLTGARSRWASCSHRRRQHQKTRLAMRMPMSRSLLSTQRAIPRLKRSWIPTTTPSRWQGASTSISDCIVTSGVSSRSSLALSLYARTCPRIVSLY